MPWRIGDQGRAELRVGELDTALAVHSGDLRVLATPRVVALVEEAAVAAARAGLEDGQTSVGVAIALDHVAPSAVGALVEAEATLVAVEGRALRFDVRATSNGVEIARGRHERVVVDAARFMARLDA